MPVYDFNSDFSTPPQPPATDVLHPIAATRSQDQDAFRSPLVGQPDNANPDTPREFLVKGFHALDAAMQLYWSGIRIPTKDAYRFVRTQVSGGDKSLQIWKDSLRDGRVKLPVISISRGTHEFNPQKFSTPALYMTRRYTDSRMTQVALVRRPVPFLVSYELTAWSTSKRDAEYVLYQIVSRFNPMAEFRVDDGYLTGNVQLQYGGSTDASEKEIGFDEAPTIRYEYKMTAEAWLPLPERLVPTISGLIVSLKDYISQEALAVFKQ